MAHNWQEKKRTSDVEIEQNISFDKMMLSDRVLLGLKNNGFTHPSPIQLRAIPLGASGLGTTDSGLDVIRFNINLKLIYPQTY